jgi:DNA-binding YbaB/EbfC family protein
MPHTQAKKDNTMSMTGNLVLQARRMQAQIQQLQDTLATQTFEGGAGGGLVKVEIDGRQKVKKITIDPEAVDPSNLSELEDLITAAVNQAIRTSQTHSRDEMKKITGGLQLPGLF